MPEANIELFITAATQSDHLSKLLVYQSQESVENEHQNKYQWAIQFSISISMVIFRHVLQMYNASIDQCSQENDELRREVYSLQTQLRAEDQRIYMLQQEIGDLNRGKVHLESELESELFNIKLLQGFIYVNFILQNTFQLSFIRFEEILLQQEDSLFSLRQGEEDGTFGFTEEIRTVSSVGQIDLERQIALLEAEGAYLAGLKEQVTTFEPPQKQFRKCINCKKDVNVRDENIDEASSPTSSHCVYHPGKLKFFSCKGCGGDEYHTCCSRCDNCNKGCRQQRHVFTRD